MPRRQRSVTVARRCSRDVEDDLLDQAAQQLLAVAVGGGGRRPDAPEVCAEPKQLLALDGGEGAGALALAQLELGLGGGQRGQPLLPVALQPAGDEAVPGAELAVAALRSLG